MTIFQWESGSHKPAVSGLGNILYATDVCLALDAKVSYVGFNGLHNRNLRPKLYQGLMEFEAVRQNLNLSLAIFVLLLTPKYHM